MFNISVSDGVEKLRWLKVTEAEQLYNCSRLSLLAMARKAGALKDIGTDKKSWYRIDRATLDAYLQCKNAGDVKTRKNKDK